MMPILDTIPVTKPRIKPSFAPASLSANKRGTRAAQAITPIPYFGNERKRRIPEVTVKNKFL
jgi:hypothetical protein